MDLLLEFQLDINEPFRWHRLLLYEGGTPASATECTYIIIKQALVSKFI